MNDSSSRRAGGGERSGPSWGLPWAPPAELDELFDRLARWAGRSPGGGSRGPRWTPVVEEDENADAWWVRLELPGIPRDRIQVEIEGHQLCVRGDLEDAGAGRTGHLAHRAGSFLYRTSLPADADRDNVHADLADGILTLTVPRVGPGQRRTVTISGRSGTPATPSAAPYAASGTPATPPGVSGTPGSSGNSGVPGSSAIPSGTSATPSGTSATPSGDRQSVIVAGDAGNQDSDTARPDRPGDRP
ncbi:hypothetical protein GCM10009839_01850 [Catenulispora yoronensis]|uniref:SHSP domain-containing protein n=1 Tax=Catenulispora yoronensis TaxID=450799 RepID=A0ABP5F0T6_9ACTN